VPLPTTDPRQVDLDAQGVLDLLDAAARLELHSIAVARGGQAVVRGWWAPYAPEPRHLLYSVSKSVTATTVATLVAEGLLGLDDPVLTHLPPAALAGVPDIADVWHRVTVRHCLTMTVGHTAEAWSAPVREAAEPIHAILASPPDAEPGTVFAYNQVATYLLSRAAEHRGGAPLDVLARERVLAPLGASDLVWETDPGGHPWGFSGVRLRTDDLLSLTQLWLDGGRSGDRQVVPAAWVEEASTPYLPVEANADSDWAQGYGQSFWNARHGYRADGAYGQYGIVLPEHGLAVAITSETSEMQEVLDLLWQHLLPAVGRAGAPGADAQLRTRLAALSIPALSTTAGAAEQRSFAIDHASDVTGVHGVQIDAEGSAVTLLRDGDPIRIDVGDGTWLTATPTVDGRNLPVAASGGWTESGYVAEIRMIETPHSFRVATGHSGALLTWRMPPLGGDDLLVCATP